MRPLIHRFEAVPSLVAVGAVAGQFVVPAGKRVKAWRARANWRVAKVATHTVLGAVDADDFDYVVPQRPTFAVFRDDSVVVRLCETDAEKVGSSADAFIADGSRYSAGAFEVGAPNEDVARTIYVAVEAGGAAVDALEDDEAELCVTLELWLK